jgi:signal transduction histidine kinase
MGVITILSMVGTYLVANNLQQDPEISALIVIFTTLIIFVIGHLIIQSFSFMAEANQMKTEFVSITTHQLRTPLSSLKWSLNLLMEGKLCPVDNKQKEYLEIMKESNERMIHLVNDLLDVSRIEQNRIDLRPQKFSLVDLIQSLVLEISPIAETKNISVGINRGPGLEQVWADQERIRMVVQNLLDNAVKYTEDRGKVSISINRQGIFLKCEINDTGVGIPAHQQKQIFQKFFRSENAKKYQTEGTGLGLFIAKGIIEASGGKIGFSSKEFEGSTFWFTIPIANKNLI